MAITRVAQNDSDYVRVNGIRLYADDLEELASILGRNPSRRLAIQIDNYNLDGLTDMKELPQKTGSKVSLTLEARHARRTYLSRCLLSYQIRTFTFRLLHMLIMGWPWKL